MYFLKCRVDGFASLTFYSWLFGDPICIYYSITITCLVQQFKNKNLFVYSFVSHFDFITKNRSKQMAS